MKALIPPFLLCNGSYFVESSENKLDGKKGLFLPSFDD